MKARLAVGIAAGMAGIVIAVATSRADPNLTNVPKHRHYVRTAEGGLVEVGPRLCDNPNLQNAFNQFHNNLHVASGSAIGPAAPGLHNFTGAELLSGGC
jgi:hypothetical protein